MNVLLDENLPHEFRHEFVGHNAATVHYQGWGGVKNGQLLALAAAAGFDVMVTLDSGVAYQQYLPQLPLAVVVLKADSNDIADLRPLVPRLLAALQELHPRTVVWVAP